ncbi:MAG TPA: hypothetical protein VF228_11265 [Iamia sp.]
MPSPTIAHNPAPTPAAVGRVLPAGCSPYEASVRDSLPTIVSFLVEMLGPRLVLHMAGRADAGAVAAWSSGHRQPRRPAERRLRTAYRAFLTIQMSDSEHTARSWFIGLNPQLGDDAPANALSEDRLRDVVVASEAFVSTS